METQAKKPAAKKAKAPSTHPKYNEMIAQAIGALKERSGSSRQAIYKYIITNYKFGDDSSVNTHLKMALRRMVSKGALLHTKGKGASGSFRLSKKVAEKKPKKPKAKKPKAKKTTTKKPKAKKAAAKKPAAGGDAKSKPKKAKSPKKKTAAKKAAKPATKKAGSKPKKAAASKKPAAKRAAKPKKSPSKKAAAGKKK